VSPSVANSFDAARFRGGDLVRSLLPVVIVIVASLDGDSSGEVGTGGSITSVCAVDDDTTCCADDDDDDDDDDNDDGNDNDVGCDKRLDDDDEDDNGIDKFAVGRPTTSASRLTFAVSRCVVIPPLTIVVPTTPAAAALSATPLSDPRCPLVTTLVVT